MTDPAPTLSPKLASDLKVRAISGFVLILIAAVELYMGGTFFVIFVAAMAAGMIWEALDLTGVQRVAPRLLAMGLCALGLLAMIPALPNQGFPVWVALLLMAGTLLVAWGASTRKRAFPMGMVAAASVCLACLTMVLSELRADFYTIPPLLLLVPAVIGTDIGAYFTGRLVGGPKLAPRVSPNKTWSGAIGGVVSAIILGLVTIYLFHGDLVPHSEFEMVLMLAGLSVCSQIGDLVESWLKRRAGRKDSGNLIPGHGGLLDRFDGFLGASLLGLGPWLLYQEFGGMVP
ncbi:MAG TPA: phosphatidate cytidylyltransferase [Rhodospirillaceae bacterium]|nr:phosphatidate cytidylyltransferase [Rhodospirillaceae bacterium]MAX61434.1 phosphatidate cytidylyltransferase [Rhodospirillaceae bacterium]MBB59063.1 phosphatidate cytidylyltransferase [Rhodospirillaceae bacterium]HBM12223.1 phosphatidate cytidylyltransferase [Rhodospirillaceae bacterium]|tara:strand:- start:37914 stop:38777 length:864 start_codon:yes stop_codon:yes gene_type:complete